MPLLSVVVRHRMLAITAADRVPTVAAESSSFTCITTITTVGVARQPVAMVGMAPSMRMAVITVDRADRTRTVIIVADRIGIMPRVDVRMVVLRITPVVRMALAAPTWPAVLVDQDVIGMLTVVRNVLVPPVGPKDRRVRTVGLAVGKLAPVAWSIA